MAIIRVLRVLEYFGEEEWVWSTLAKGAVPANGEHRLSETAKIKSGLIGYPDYKESDQLTK